MWYAVVINSEYISFSLQKNTVLNVDMLVQICNYFYFVTKILPPVAKQWPLSFLNFKPFFK